MEKKLAQFNFFLPKSQKKLYSFISSVQRLSPSLETQKFKNRRRFGGSAGNRNEPGAGCATLEEVGHSPLPDGCMSVVCFRDWAKMCIRPKNLCLVGVKAG